MKSTLELVIDTIWCIALSIFIIFTALFSDVLFVNAAVSENQKVVSHSATWEGYPFTFTLGGKYYTIQDPQGIPTSTYQNPNFFYTHDNVKFDMISGIDIYTFILNKNLGIIVKDTLLTTIYNSFTTLINVLDTNDEYLQGGLYDNNGNFLGYCLNDISGCYYAANSTDGLDYNQDLPNDIYNHYKYYQSENPEIPPFFTYKPISNSGILSNIKNTSITQNEISFLNSLESNNFLLYGLQYDTGGYFFNCSGNNKVSYFENEIYFVGNYGNWGYPDFCKKYGLINGKQELTYTQLIAKWGVGADYMQLTPYDSVTNEAITTINIGDISTQTSSTVNYAGGQFYFGYQSQQVWPNASISMGFNNSFTIFQNVVSKTNVDNQNYFPNSYVTDSYNNYDNSITDSYNTTKTNVDNSVQNNGDAYTDCNNDFYNYYDNGYYDSSSQITNNTTIINNYYPDNSGGGGDDPNNPDNPDDNSTLDAILRALLRFFDAIGDIIGTIFAGLLTLIDDVLESIAGIISSMSGVSDFFAALFAWLPEPIPTMIAAGVSICILAAIIRFFRG